MASPVTATSTMLRAAAARSASVWLTRTVARPIGSERNRSISPFSRSPATPIAVMPMQESPICANTPAMMYSR